MNKEKGFTLKGLVTTLAVIFALLIALVFGYSYFFSTDLENNISRRVDTVTGGDYVVSVVGSEKVYYVFDDKVTSSVKGYYIFYPTIDGKKTLVQTPVAITIVEKVD